MDSTTSTESRRLTMRPEGRGHWARVFERLAEACKDVTKFIQLWLPVTGPLSQTWPPDEGSNGGVQTQHRCGANSKFALRVRMAVRQQPSRRLSTPGRFN